MIKKDELLGWDCGSAVERLPSTGGSWVRFSAPHKNKGIVLCPSTKKNFKKRFSLSLSLSKKKKMNY